MGHRHLDARRPRPCRPCSSRSAASAPPGSRRPSHRLISCMHGQAGRSRLASATASPMWSKWPWVTSIRSQRSIESAVRGLRGLPNHGSIRIDLAARRPDLEAGVAVPGERRVRDRVPSRATSGSRCLRSPATLDPVSATQIGQNLAFINWTVLTGLALGHVRGGRPAPPADRPRRPATSRFTTLCALGFGVLAWISDGALPRVARRLAGRASTRPGTARAASACCCSAILVAAVARRPARPAPRAPRSSSWAALAAAVADASCSAPSRGAAASLGAVLAARPAGGRQRGDRRRLRGDDPRPLVPRDAEAARGAAHPARARPARRRRRPGRAVRGLGRDRRRARPTSRRSRRWSGRGRCSSGCA